MEDAAECSAPSLPSKYDDQRLTTAIAETRHYSVYPKSNVHEYLTAAMAWVLEEVIHQPISNTKFGAIIQA